MNEMGLSNRQISQFKEPLRIATYSYNKNANMFKKDKNNEKENVNMEEKLNKFIEEHEIHVEDNGDFTMYIVVDADDENNEVGAIIYKGNTEAYTKKRAYEDLNQNKHFRLTIDGWSPAIETFFYNNIELKKKTTIKEDLLKMEDKMFVVSVNKKDVSDVKGDVIYVNKYKVLEEVELNPILKFKIKEINKDKEESVVILYNNLTKKSKTITLGWISSLEDAKFQIREYLERDEWQVELVNSIADDGAELQ